MEAEGVTSFLSVASWGRGEEGDTDLLSGYPVMGHIGMVQSCAMGGLGLIFLPREWSNAVTVSWRTGWHSQLVNVLRGISTMPLITHCSFWAALKWSDSWTGSMFYATSNWNSLFYCILEKHWRDVILKMHGVHIWGSNNHLETKRKKNPEKLPTLNESQFSTVRDEPIS